MDRRMFCMELLGSGLVVGSLISEGFGQQPKAAAAQKLQWHKNLKAAHKLAVATDKPLLIVFGASWCAYCHKLERETLTDQRLVAMIQKEFVPVHLDFDADSKVAKILEVERLPCTVVLSPQADLLLKSEGFADYKGYLKVLQTAMTKQSEIRQVQNQEPAR